MGVVFETMLNRGLYGLLITCFQYKHNRNNLLYSNKIQKTFFDKCVESEFTLKMHVLIKGDCL
jgi:hypothetical protein